MTAESEEVRNILASLYAKAEETESMRPFECSRHIAMAMFGFCQMSSEYDIVRVLIKNFAQRIDLSTFSLSPQAISNALYGLKSMDAEYEEVRFFLRILATKIKHCETFFTPADIGMALYGMKGKDSKYLEVNEVIMALTQKMKEINTKFKFKEIGMAIAGMNRFSSADPQVRMLLAVLTPFVATCTESLQMITVDSVLQGLRYMSTDYIEVRQLISNMNPHFKRFDAPLHSRDIVRLSSLKHLSCDLPEVKELLRIIARWISNCPEKLRPQEYRIALHGLHKMRQECAEVKELRRVLEQKYESNGGGKHLK
jgi:hypothetical protein